MSDALEEYDGKVSIGGRNIIRLQCAHDIDALAEENQGLETLVVSLDKACTKYKRGLMTNSVDASKGRAG